MTFLTPHLAREMPTVAAVVPWLLAWDVLLLIGAHAAAFGLARFESRLTMEEARALMEHGRHTMYRSTQNSLIRTRRGLITVAALITLSAAALSLTEHFTPALVEIFFVVIGIGFVAPMYISVSLLAKAFGGVADRLEGLREGAAPERDP